MFVEERFALHVVFEVLFIISKKCSQPKNSAICSNRESEQMFSAWVDNTDPRRLGLFNDNLSSRHKLPPLEILDREASVAPKTK